MSIDIALVSVDAMRSSLYISTVMMSDALMILIIATTIIMNNDITMMSTDIRSIPVDMIAMPIDIIFVQSSFDIMIIMTVDIIVFN